jgi:conjugative relaxase-like TrwC/TraI family protein
MVLRISSGYSVEYLLKEVATGRENYYTGAVAVGEPPGRWWGAGAERFGLSGLVDAQDMRALFEGFLDPRAEGFRDPARWDEVDTLGHTGRKYRSEDELYATALEQEPNASPERRAELRVQAGKAVRQNVAFFDMTFSVQKSVTLVHTAFEAQEVKARNAGDHEAAEAWGQFRAAVEEAIWAGNNAGLAYMQDRAGYTRVGKHGGAAGRWADAHEWTVASFFQHDSRDHDPQLHIHNTVLNKVQGPDGVWRTIDGRSLYRWRPAGAAVAERTTAERLTHALGLLLATRPDGKAREVLGVATEAMDLISTRRHTLTAKAAELTQAFEARYGRAPNGLERERLAQQATLLTRRSKSHTGESREEVLDRVHEKLRGEIDGGLHGVAHTALAARGDGPPEPMRWSPEQVIATALAEVQASRAGYTRADLAAAIDRALPDYLGVTGGHDIGELLDQLTDQALGSVTCLDTARPGDAQLPDALRLDNGASAYVAPGSQLYATPEQVHRERVLAAATAAGDAAALPHPVVARFLAGLAAAGVQLGPDQAAAVRGVLTSGARVETLIGPAGTGKSFVVGTIARAWTQPAALPGLPDARADGAVDADGAVAGPSRVFGLATSQIATEVLKAEGLTASNVAAWLGAQRRLGNGTGTGPRATAADEAWRLRAGDLVVVDESAMTDTAALSAIHARADAVGAKLLLVGDHRQLAAVGAGGGMDLVAASGACYELAEARRFTHTWERDASLQLRAGDELVLRTYHQQGRLLDSGTADQAEQSAATAWLGDTLAGQRSMLLVDTNEQAARLSASLRAELVRLGQVQERGVALGLQGTVASEGDIVEARKLDWTLAGVEGNPRGVINRERFRVTAVRDDGALEVIPLHGGNGRDGEQDARMVLPAQYVAEHLALGYASTVHAAQGTTVDTTHTVVTGRTGPAALYVGMSRGREANTAHVATLAGVEDPAQGGLDQTVHRDPVAVLARVLDTTDAVDAANRSAVATAEQSAAEAGSAHTAAELLADAAQLAATERTATWLDQLTDNGALTNEQRAQVAAQDGAATLTRILRRVELAGHDPHQALTDAVTASDLAGARNLANVLYARIRTGHADQLDPIGDTFTDWTPHTDNPQWNAYLTALAAQVDQRAADLGQQAADDGVQAPGWAVEAFGPVPADDDARATWARQVGQVAAYREIRGHDQPAADGHPTADSHAAPVRDGVGDALGPAPGAGQVEQYAAYRAAWRTLGRPDTARDLAELTDGQLWIRVHAAEREDKWGPRYVANELAGTRQAADTQRRTAALRDAEAQTTTDPSRQEQLREQAGQARSLAATLEHQAAQLQFVDDARARHLLDTTVTRLEGTEARGELARRHQDDPTPPERVTADEWLTAHRAAAAEDDQHRHITPDDLDDHTAEDTHADSANDASSTADAVEQADSREVLHAPEPDIREVAAAEPAPVDEDHLRRPSADEVAGYVTGAQRTLVELDARATYDRQHEQDERAAELARWHHDDQHSNDNHTADAVDDVFGGYDDGSARSDPDDVLVDQS